MLTVWKYTPQDEAKTLLVDCRDIANGFFRINGFNILSTDCGPDDQSIVTIPDLHYRSIQKFWQRVAKIPVDLAISDAELLKAAEKLLTDNNFTTEPDMAKTKAVWQKAEKEIITAIEKITGKNIAGITIHPTNFGTQSTFTVTTKFPAKIDIYLRFDQDIWGLTDAILLSLLRFDLWKKYDALWGETQIVAEWLATDSSLTRILKKYQPKTNFKPTLVLVRGKEQGKIKQESEKFLNKIGAPTSIPPICTDKITALSLSEKKVLNRLLLKRSQIVSFDEISGILSPNPDDFSLYAVSKTIQRLRNKLSASGLSGSAIQTIRGQGYLLRN